MARATEEHYPELNRAAAFHCKPSKLPGVQYGSDLPRPEGAYLLDVSELRRRIERATYLKDVSSGGTASPAEINASKRLIDALDNPKDCDRRVDGGPGASLWRQCP